MKKLKKYTLAGLCCLLLFSLHAGAQQKLSIDLAAIRNVDKPLNGLNVSGFYHFNKKVIAGLEANRFFPAKRLVAGEDVKISAWDIELNTHYLFALYKGLHLYPIAGIGHSTEKEMNLRDGASQYESFWSVNTGAGILWELEKWSPHIEYCFAWGRQNQQFLLAGISYEIEWKHDPEKK